MSAPSDAEIAAAVRVLAAALGIGATSPAAFFDQTHLPPGVTRDAFLRLHRARTRERVPGWSRRGKSRLVTPEAWSAEIERDTSRVSHRRAKSVSRPALRSVDDDLDRALGIRTKGGAVG